MAERTPCEIEVGGAITKNQIAGLVALMEYNGCGLDWSEATPTLEEALLAAEEGAEEGFFIRDNQTRGGRWEDIEGYLEKEKIQYIMLSDGDGEFDGTRVLFNGVRCWETGATSDKSPTYSEDLVKTVFNLLNEEKGEEAKELLSQNIAPDNIEPISLILDEPS